MTRACSIIEGEPSDVVRGSSVAESVRALIWSKHEVYETDMAILVS